MQLGSTTLLWRAAIISSIVILTATLCSAFFFSSVAQAEVLDPRCATLFRLPSDTETSSNPYLNSATCAAYQDLLSRYANCTRIQLDRISCHDAIVKLNPNFAQNLDAMLQRMTAAGYSVSIISATVNRPGTDLLGRTAVSSNHQLGCAADIVVSGWNTREDTRCTSTACRVAQQAAAQFGLRSLGYYPQFNHFQPSGNALAVCQKAGRGAGVPNALVASTLALSMPSFSLDETAASSQSGYQSLADWTSSTPTMQPIAVNTGDYDSGSMMPASQDDAPAVPTTVDHTVPAELPQQRDSAAPPPSEISDLFGDNGQTYTYGEKDVARIAETPSPASILTERPQIENSDVPAPRVETPGSPSAAPITDITTNTAEQYPCWFGLLYCPPTPVASAPIPPPLEMTSEAPLSNVPTPTPSSPTREEPVVASAPIPPPLPEPAPVVNPAPAATCTSRDMPRKEQYPAVETWMASLRVWFDICYRRADQ